MKTRREKEKILSKVEEPKGPCEASDEDTEEELGWKRHIKKKSTIKEADLNLEDTLDLPCDGLEDIDWEILDPQTSDFALPRSQPQDDSVSTFLKHSEVEDQSEEKRTRMNMTM
ncbi:hypothetical protein GOP47_0027207 [Adiantum capillus-veneris]|nr:hypothetical protein GOP47_0027207 [Adiantum capillus-veneris]